MPTYTYECVNCDARIDEERRMEQRREMATCGECGGACELVIATPPAGFMKGGPTVPTSKRRISK